MDLADEDVTQYDEVVLRSLKIKIGNSAIISPVYRGSAFPAVSTRSLSCVQKNQRFKAPCGNSH